MARIDVPAGDTPEIYRVWELSPELGKSVAKLSDAVYNKSNLPARVREVARMRIAQLNGCSVCLGWRMPELAEHGVTEEMYAHVDDPSAGDYNERELLAIEFAERFAVDHHNIDDAFFDRLKEHFTDAEILELTISIGDWVGFGRLTMVLDLDEACATRLRAESALT
jgi:AhpD family alkylhydroperoxidase